MFESGTHTINQSIIANDQSNFFMIHDGN